MGAALADPTDAGRTVPMSQIGLDDDPAPAVEVYKEGPRQGPSYASEPSPTMDSIPRKRSAVQYIRIDKSAGVWYNNGRRCYHEKVQNIPFLPCHHRHAR